MSKRDEVLQRTRKLILPASLAGGVVVLGLWILFFISTDESHILGLSRISWLTVAAVVTVLGPPFIFFAVRNRLALLNHGLEVRGKIEAISKVSRNGARPVTYGYSVNGDGYSIKRDTADMLLENANVGSPVILLVDPQKPAKAMVLDHQPAA